MKHLLKFLFIFNTLVIAFFIIKTGFRDYIITISVVTFGGLIFLFLAVKHGSMIGKNGMVIKKEDNPFRFYANVALLLGIYLFMLAVSIGLFLQETEHRN